MDKGKKLLMGTKDEIVESHSLIKADKSLLNPETKKLFVNIRENKFGFEGLTNQLKDLSQHLTKDYVIEKPRVEDIMYYYCKK